MQATPSAHRPITYRLFLPLLAVAALAGGCSTLDIPRADNYPATGQKKARAVHHWDVLADDVAQRIAEKIGDWPAGEYPIYIPPAGDSGFNLGFRKLLITRLVDRGITVSTHPTAVELAFDAQIVQHYAPVSNSLQMPFTRLAAGVAVARDWHLYAQSTTSVVTSALAAGALLDASLLATNGAAAGGPTRTEVLITTSLESGQRYLARTADVYYIEADDTPLYALPPPLPAPTPLKTWRVVVP
ncbi:MAG: hypothetical protein K2Q11_08865 [Burkholderiaceae bacterium]|nr:hypothetical protein [Burkholderiaceae bacterium]